MSSMAKKGGGGGKGGGKAPKKIGSPLSIVAFQDRVVVEGEIFNAVVSSATGPDGEVLHSSLPHLTHGNDARAAHITSSRVVATTEPYVIHQRFHQDNDGQSAPTHDRYFAVHKATGVVHGVTASFTPGLHLGKKDVMPMRGATLAETEGVHAKITFEVKAVDDKVPPLSPRSRERTLPPEGYKG